MLKSSILLIAVLNAVLAIPYAHWDECKEQQCSGLQEGWMCCQITSQQLDNGDIPLDKGYSKICSDPKALNIVPKGVETEFVQEGDTFFCTSEDHKEYTERLMEMSKKERSNEGLIVTVAIGASAALVVGFAGWAYYMWGMNL